MASGFNSVDNLIGYAKGQMSDYCLKDCQRYCCRDMYINTKNPGEVRAVLNISDGSNIDNIKDSRLTIKDFFLRDDEYILNLTPCPRLEGTSCSLDGNPDKPSVCKEYPIQKDDRNSTVWLSKTCKAVESGFFNQFRDMFAGFGYTMRRSDDTEGISRK